MVKFLIIVALLPLILWMGSMMVIRLSGGRIHAIWKTYMRFIIRAFIFFIPLAIFISIFKYLNGDGTASTVLSLLSAILVYMKISKKYAKKLIGNIYLKED